MKVKPVWTQGVLLAIAALVCAGGLALLAASFVPFEWVKGRADRLTVDGSADFLTPAFVARVMLRARIAGALALAAGLVLILVRDPVAHWLTLIGRSAVVSARRALGRGRVFFREEDRLHLVALGVILVCAVGIRVAFLAQPMRYDEAYTYLRYASKPIYVALSDYSAPNNHVFHTLLVHLSTRLLGGAPWAIRLPALLAGIALVPATYAAGRALYGRDAALLAAALVAASSALIEFSVNARGYTLLALCALLILALAVYLRRADNPAAWVLFALLSALGFYTLPVMLYPFGIVAVWLAWSTACGDAPVGTRRLLLDLLAATAGAGVLTLVFYAPVLLASGPAALAGNPFIAPRGWGDFLAETANELRLTWDQWHRDLPVVLTLAWAASLVVAVCAHGRLARHRVPVIAAVLLWCVPLVLVQQAVVFRRVWLFLLPWYLIMVAAGLAYGVNWLVAKISPGLARSETGQSGKTGQSRAVGGRGSGVGSIRSAMMPLLALVLCLGLSWNVWRMQSVSYSDETEAVRAAPAIASFLRHTLRPGDRVLAADPASTVLEYYLSSYGVPTAYLVADVQSGGRVFVVVQQSPGRSRPALDDLLREAGLPSATPDARPVESYDGAVVYELASPR